MSTNSSNVVSDLDLVKYLLNKTDTKFKEAIDTYKHHVIIVDSMELEIQFSYLGEIEYLYNLR